MSEAKYQDGHGDWQTAYVLVDGMANQDEHGVWRWTE